MLLGAGADIENLGGADKTPLMNATFAGHTPIVHPLVRAAPASATTCSTVSR